MGAKRLCALLAALCAAAAAAGVARTAPLTVHLVIDESQSMRGSKASYTTTAVQTAVALVPEGTRVAIVGFGEGAKEETKGYVTIGGNRDRERLRDIVAEIAFNGQRTNYLDPLKLVEPRVLASDGATLVIFLSDGADNVNTGRRGWQRVLDAAKAIHVSGARLETIFLESKGGIGSLLGSPKRNRQRMVEMAGGGGKFHPIVGKPVQIVDVLLEILGDLANYAKVDVDEHLGRKPDATISQLVLLGFPPSRARAIQLARDGAPADLKAYGVYPYPAPKDAAQGTTDRYSLIKVFSIPRPGGHAWSLRPARKAAEWEARALERRGVFFEFATGAPKPAYDLPRETVRAIIEVSGPGAPKPEALLKALPGLDGQLAVTSQTGAQQEDWKALASSRWFRLVPEIRDARLLLVPETAEKDGRLPESETRRLIALARQAKDANYTCVARIRFGREGQRGEVVKQKSFKVQVTLGVSASPGPLDLGIVAPGAATGPKTLAVSCNWAKATRVAARLDSLVSGEGDGKMIIAGEHVQIAPAAFPLPGTKQIALRLSCPADAPAGPCSGTLRFTEVETGHGVGECRVRAVVAPVLRAPKLIVLKGNAGGDAVPDPRAELAVGTNSAAPISVTLEVAGKLPGELVARLVSEKASRGKPARLAVTLRSIPPATKPGVYEAAATASATVPRPEGGTYVVKSAPIAIRAELSGCELAAEPAQLRLGPTVAGDRTKPARLTVQTNATAALAVQCKPSDLVGPNGARIPASRLAVAWAAQPIAKRAAPATAAVSLDLRHAREGQAVRPLPPGDYAGKLSLTAEGAATQVQVTASVLPVTLEAAPAVLAFPAALAAGMTVPLKLAVSTNTPDPLPLKLDAGDLTAESGAKLAAKRIRITWATPREVSQGKPARLEMVVDLAPTVTRRPDKEPVIRPVAEGTYKGKLSLSASGCATRQVAVTVAVRPISIEADPQAIVFEPGLAGGETNAVRLTVHTNSPADLPIKHAAGALLGKDGARIPADRVRVEWDGKPVAKHGTPAVAKVFVNLRHTTVRRREAAPVIHRFPPGEYAGSLTLSAPGCGDVSVALKLAIETTWLRAAPAKLAFAPTSGGKTTPPLKLTVSTNSPAGVSFALAPSDLVGKGKTIPAERVQVAWDAEAVTRKIKPAVATLTVDLGHETVTTPERGRVVRQIPRGEYRGRLTVSAEGFEPQTVPVSVNVVSVTLGAKPGAVALKAKAGGDAVRAPPIVLTTNAPGPIEVTLGKPRDAWLAAAPGKEHKAVERLPFEIAMEPAAVRLSAGTPQSGRTVRLAIGEVWPGAGGTYGCKVDAVARGLSATIDVTVTVEPIRLWFEPAELDLGKAVAGGTSGVGEVRVLTDSQQPVSVAVSVGGAVKEAAGRPTVALLDKPLAVSAKAPGTVSMRASAPRGAQAGQHRFAVTCRATEWDGTAAQATVLARVAQPAYNVEPRLVDFGTGLTGSTLGPGRLTLSSDIAAPEKASLTCSPFSFERGGKRVTLVGARVAATQSAGEVAAGKPVVFELRLSVPRNYRKLPEREPVYDVVAEGTYAAEAAIEVGGQVRHRVPLRVTVKRRPRK